MDTEEYLNAGLADLFLEIAEGFKDFLQEAGDALHEAAEEMDDVIEELYEDPDEDMYAQSRSHSARSSCGKGPKTDIRKSEDNRIIFLPELRD